jgi:hypothetical protein
MTMLGWALVVLLGGLGLFGGWRQLVLLRKPLPKDLPSELHGHVRSQAYRRLVMSGMLCVLGGMLLGSFLLGMPERAQEIFDAGRQQRAVGEEPHLNADQQAFLVFASGYWLVVVLLLLTVIVFAALDLWAIRRYEIVAMRQLQDDRRDMLERELSVYRSLRNGHQH